LFAENCLTGRLRCSSRSILCILWSSSGGASYSSARRFPALQGTAFGSFDSTGLLLQLRLSLKVRAAHEESNRFVALRRSNARTFHLIATVQPIRESMQDRQGRRCEPQSGWLSVSGTVGYALSCRFGFSTTVRDPRNPYAVFSY
jgi:hypothetical protein